MNYKIGFPIQRFTKEKVVQLIGSLILLIFILIEARGASDFDIFLSAAHDLMLHKNIYAEQYHQWYHYYYDVLFALVLVPFASLPPYLANLLWLSLNIVFFYRIFTITMNYLPLSLLNNKARKLFMVLSIIFVFRFVKDNIHLGQMTIFILSLSLEGLHLIHRNKKISGALLIAIAITIKLLPILLIPYLFYRKEWKAGIAIFLFMAILMVLPAIVIGWDYNSFLLSERWHLINPMNKEHLMDTSERSFHSLTTLLATLLVRNTGDFHELHIRRNIADVSLQTLNLFINIARGMLILFSLWFLRSMPFKTFRNKLQTLYEVSYLLLITPLIFPHQQHYAFLFIFPATTYLLFRVFARYFNGMNKAPEQNSAAKKSFFIVFLFITYLATNSHLLLGEFDNYYDHFKTLTYGVFLLLILLAMNPPDSHHQDAPNS